MNSENAPYNIFVDSFLNVIGFLLFSDCEVDVQEVYNLQRVLKLAMISKTFYNRRKEEMYISLFVWFPAISICPYCPPVPMPYPPGWTEIWPKIGATTFYYKNNQR